MEQDRKRAKDPSYTRPPGYRVINAYFAPFSIISFIIGFGVLIHIFQGRYELSFFDVKKHIDFFLSLSKVSDSNYAADPRSRSYHAYREWQRLSALKDAHSIPMRDRSIRRDEEK